MTDNVTKIIVNKRYSPIRGTTNEVEGMISVITNRKTVKVNKTEIHNVILIKMSKVKMGLGLEGLKGFTFSPESDGR